MAEGLGLGYALTGFIVTGLIALFVIAWRLKLNPVLAFWAIYILTRPLGASLGDYLSQPAKYGGLGLGATMTSFIFIGGILALVAYLSISKRDVIGKHMKEEIVEDEQRGGLIQTAVVVVILLVAGGIGYHARQTVLNSVADTAKQESGVGSSPLGDLASFRTITQDTLDLLDAGNQPGATTRIGDLEYEWDNAEAKLKSKDLATWTKIDGKIDTVLRELRAVNPNGANEKAALEALLVTLK